MHLLTGSHSHLHLLTGSHSHLHGLEGQQDVHVRLPPPVTRLARPLPEHLEALAGGVSGEGGEEGLVGVGGRALQDGQGTHVLAAQVVEELEAVHAGAEGGGDRQPRTGTTTTAMRGGQSHVASDVALNPVLIEYV
jgi:hypothetical protein